MTTRDCFSLLQGNTQHTGQKAVAASLPWQAEHHTAELSWVILWASNQLWTNMRRSSPAELQEAIRDTRQRQQHKAASRRSGLPSPFGPPLGGKSYHQLQACAGALPWHGGGGCWLHTAAAAASCMGVPASEG